MAASLRIGLVQVTAGRTLAPNIAKAERLIDHAAKEGANFIVTPENVTMIEPKADAARHKAVVEAQHPGLEALRACAARNNVWLLIGSLSIRTEAGPTAGMIANRSFLIDAAGAITARYDKIHLFDVSLADGESYRESDYVAPGDRAVLAATPWGPLGMTICYDIRFPHLYRDLAKAGAVMMSIPAAFTETTGRAHWHALNRARAIETGSYVLAPAQWGEHAEGRRTYGHSLVVDPWGAIVADGEEGEGLTFADIDLSAVRKARAHIPSLSHDRAYQTVEPGI